MAQSSRRGRPRPGPIVRQDLLPEDRCYLCDAVVKRAEEIVRIHEATVHRRCYEEDIRRGR